jgi:SAM-dependent methyltransferase
MSDVEGFYDRLAGEYDLMTGSGQRYLRERPFFHLLVEQHHIKTALDVGCGTGVHAMLLSRLGLNVTAIDISGEMLRKLNDNAKLAGLTNIRSIEANLLDVDPVGLLADGVFCLGNTLPHFVSDADMTSAIRKLFDLVRDEGILFLQMLNFEKILRDQKRVHSVREEGGKTFIRFFDLDGSTFRLNILVLDRAKGVEEEDLRSTALRPILFPELSGLLRNVGFSKVRCFGSISMDKFRPETSGDLVVLAMKG